MVHVSSTTRKRKNRNGVLFFLADLTSGVKIVFLILFLGFCAFSTNLLFKPDEDEIYNEKHFTRAKTRPIVDLSQVKELKVAIDEEQKVTQQQQVTEEKSPIKTNPVDSAVTDEASEDSNDKFVVVYESIDDTEDYALDIDDDDVVTAPIAILRAYDIEEKLESLSEPDDLHDWTSAQGKAFQWIVNDDERMVNADDPHLVQRFALAVFFYATGGENWHSGDLHWLTGVHECFWSKKVKGLMMGVIECDDDKNIRRIDLSENNLAGSIPTELGLLEELEGLDLQENRIGGRIPKTLGFLSSLTAIELNSNKLVGEVPSELGTLSKLNVMHLDANELTGAIPPEICHLANTSSLMSFWSDCSGDESPVECSCCTMCCDGLGYCLSASDLMFDDSEEGF